VIEYFSFQIWIQCGQIIKIHLFSYTSKTKSLNLFFSVTIIQAWSGGGDRWVRNFGKTMSYSRKQEY